MRSNTAFRIVHLNTQGMCNKLNNIEVFLGEVDPDIVCVSEHWNNNVQMNFVNITQFNLVNSFCREHYRHGGSAIYCKNDIKLSCLKYSHPFNMEMHFESSTCIFNLNNYKIGLLTIYRPPNSCYETFITNLPLALFRLSQVTDYIILCGDLNVDLLKPSLKLDLLLDIFHSFDMQCKINTPTRFFTNVNGVSSASAIDCVATNLKEDFLDCYSTEANVADHLAQIINIRVNNINDTPVDNNIIEHRALSVANLQEFKSRLNMNNWSALYACSEINNACNDFVDTVAWCFNVSCPRRRINSSRPGLGNRTNNWVNDAVIESSRSLRDLFWLKNQINSPDINSVYADCKKHHNKLVNDTKRSYFTAVINSSNNKNRTVWKLVNDTCKRKVTKDEKIKIVKNGIAVTDESTICEEFGNHFSGGILQKITNAFGNIVNTGSYVRSSLQNSFFFGPLCSDDVRSIIRDMRSKRSSGLDEISSYILKYVAEELVHHLTHLINLSFASGEFPDVLKSALVLPLYKKGDPTQLENYRPVSLLSVFSKVFEKAAYMQLTNFMNKNHILSDRQHGFRSKRSTESALIELMQHVYERLDENLFVAGVFFDLTQAFDCVDPDLLCCKLDDMGVRGVPLDWIRSYLSDRKMKIRVGNSVSKCHHINLGVPQGSVLGPLLFLVFANDLPQAVADGGFSVLYADDASVVVSARNQIELIDKVKRVLSVMETWCSKNHLLLNLGKTSIISFHKRRELTSTSVEFVSSVKVLGIYIDDRLTWNDHIEHVSKKLNSAFFAIAQLKSRMTNDCLLNVYYALVQSVLSYNVIIWGQSSNWLRVFVAQKRIVRLIFGLGRTDSCREVFGRHKLMTFPTLYLYKCALFYKKNVNVFDKYKLSHDYQTRNAGIAVPPAHRLTLFRKSPDFACLSIYNNLPTSLRSVSDLQIFKRRLREFFLDRCLYSVDEYFNM